MLCSERRPARDRAVRSREGEVGAANLGRRPEEVHARLSRCIRKYVDCVQEEGYVWDHGDVCIG